VTANAHPGAAGTATDPERLASWLRDRLGLPADRVSLTPLTGGNSNETVLVSAGDRRFVLRRPPRDPLAPSAHDMGREHRLLRALARTDVPAPRPVAYCADPEVIGAPFLLMEFIADGVSLTDRLPPAYAGAPDAVGELGRGMVRALATLHRVDWRAAGLEGFGRPQGFLARQVGRWRAQLDRYRVRPLPLFEEIAAWLERNRPEEQPPTLMHGDFHLDNCLFSAHEPRLLAIIDWEMATVGDPLLDLGLALAFWGPRPIQECAMPRIQAVSRAPGAPSREELAAEYAELTGRSIERLDYYMCLAFWKLAAIVEGAYAQHVSGRLNTEYAAALERDVPRLLEEAACIAGL